MNSVGNEKEENVETQVTTSRKNGHHFAQDALSNPVVLRNIFIYLKENDIDSCCKVNTTWNAIAHRLLITHYDIQEDVIYGGKVLFSSCIPRKIVRIRKRASHKNQAETYIEKSFQNTDMYLEAAIPGGKIAINLEIISDIQDEDISRFAFKFGSVIDSFSPRNTLATRKFCEFLVTYLQNVKRLDLSSSKLCVDISDEYLDVNLRQSPLSRLRVIQFGSQIDYHSVLTLLQMAPNLEEVHNFAVVWADALVEAHKTESVKTLTFKSTQMEPTSLQNGLQKLSNLELRLTSFNFVLEQHQDLLCQETNWPWLLRILQSSKDSLESMALCKIESVDLHLFPFEALPPMGSLSTLTFVLHVEGHQVARFFGRQVVLREVFPAVTTIIVPGDFHDPVIVDTSVPFPEAQFLPWGRQIETLRLEHVSVDLLAKLGRLYPSVKNLELCGCTSTGFVMIIQAIGDHWPGLESFTVVITGGFLLDQSCTVDSLITGFPDSVITQLKDRLSRTCAFSPNEIRKLKDESTFRKFRNLKILKFKLFNNWAADRFLKAFSDISGVAKGFGFDCLPGLRIIMQTCDRNTTKVLDMKTTLKAFVNLEIEQIDD